MKPVTTSQKMAQAAYRRISQRNPGDREFAAFARSFPALIHMCGLAQAVAFARAKTHTDYLEDLAAVLSMDAETLENASLEKPVLEYIRLNRNALEAAGWLKRYAEALVLAQTTEPG